MSTITRDIRGTLIAAVATTALTLSIACGHAAPAQVALEQPAVTVQATEIPPTPAVITTQTQEQTHADTGQARKPEPVTATPVPTPTTVPDPTPAPTNETSPTATSTPTWNEWITGQLDSMYCEEANEVVRYENTQKSYPYSADFYCEGPEPQPTPGPKATSASTPEPVWQPPLAQYQGTEQAVAAMTVYVETPDEGSGSGFFYPREFIFPGAEHNARYYVVTNWHVVGDYEEVMVCWAVTQTCVSGEVIASGGEYFDVAIVDHDGFLLNDDQALWLEETEAQLYWGGDFRKGDVVYASGYPGGNYAETGQVVSDPVVTKGIIVSTELAMWDHPFIEHGADVEPGSSGGPLMNNDLTIVGINTAISREHERLELAVPMYTVINWTDPEAADAEPIESQDISTMLMEDLWRCGTSWEVITGLAAAGPLSTAPVMECLSQTAAEELIENLAPVLDSILTNDGGTNAQLEAQYEHSFVVPAGQAQQWIEVADEDGQLFYEWISVKDTYSDELLELEFRVYIDGEIIEEITTSKEQWSIPLYAGQTTTLEFDNSSSLITGKRVWLNRRWEPSE